VSLDLAPAECVVVLGANGSGKSTLAQLANGLLLPGRGRVTVDDLDTSDAEHVREIRQRVGIVLQHPDDQIVATSVEDDIAFGPENLGLPREEIRRRVAEAIDAVGLAGLERREPHLLSGGQKQRLAIAGALAMRPTYLVVDEPCSMLDPVGRAEVLTVLENLRAAGHGILHITHDLADAWRADRALVLSRGEVEYLGSVSGLLGDEGLLARTGLELPPVAVLAAALRDAGAPVEPGALDADLLAEALWR
jgi:energy-coupling factor transport system ATP-binding protein